MALDMQPAGNTYDDSTNSMAVGAVDDCLTSEPGNNAQHTHNAHLIIQDVEDLVGWQARLSYDGGQMRPSTVNFTPFTDSTTGQNVSFVNLPLEDGVHRDVVTATNIPPQAAELQTALVGSVYNGPQSAAVSPDSPAKAPLDDTSYSVSGGGVLASLTLNVQADQAGEQSLAIDLDDNLPNTPGSNVVLFTESGTTTTNLTELQLGDGFHGEGAACLPVVMPQMPAVGSTQDEPVGPDSHEGPSHCATDFNADLYTDISDLSLILGRFGASVPPESPAYDLNADGWIDISDVSKVTAEFGNFCLLEAGTEGGTQAVSAEQRLSLGEPPIALALTWECRYWEMAGYTKEPLNNQQRSGVYFGQTSCRVDGPPITMQCIAFLEVDIPTQGWTVYQQAPLDQVGPPDTICASGNGAVVLQRFRYYRANFCYQVDNQYGNVVPWHCITTRTFWVP